MPLWWQFSVRLPYLSLKLFHSLLILLWFGALPCQPTWFSHERDTLALYGVGSINGYG